VTTAHTISRKPILRKPPAKRLFSGMAGSPLARNEQDLQKPAITVMELEPEPEIPNVRLEPPKSAVTQAQEIVLSLMEAVDEVEGTSYHDRDEKVRQVVRDTFSSPGPEIPAKRGRGRPRKYSGVTVQQRDAERKRLARSKANLRLVQLLRHFELEVTSQIPPGLKTTYGLEVNTYRELLDSERVQTKVIKEIIRDLKMIGAIKTPTSDSESAGKFMTDAPSRKGKLIYIDNPDAVHGKRQLREQDLSKPTGNPEHNFVLPGHMERPTGDRRRVRPKGRGPDTYPQDGE